LLELGARAAAHGQRQRHVVGLDLTALQRHRQGAHLLECDLAFPSRPTGGERNFAAIEVALAVADVARANVDRDIDRQVAVGEV